MSSRRRRSPDHFARRARRTGLAARSVFKLEEMDRRWRLLRAGDAVLDLGCAPGSWMQYASSRVGPKGRVLGYDLQAVSLALPVWVEIRQGDVFETPLTELGGPFQVVLSDMAPATMGDHKTDALRSAALAERALQLAETLLVPHGKVVVKVLEGGEVPGLAATMGQSYGKVERLRPKATRKESTEIFLIGLDKKG